MNTQTPIRKRWSPAIWIQFGCLTALVLAAILLITPPAGGVDTVPPGPSVLVLYDNEGQYGWLGEIYSAKLQNLLGHFEARVVRKPFSQYLAGDLQGHDATFYLASVWNETPLPAAFRTDLETSTQPFVWVGVNLWRYAWNLTDYSYSPAFEQIGRAHV